MKIDFLVVGKLKKNSDYLAKGIEEYTKRLGPYAKLRWIELGDEIITPTKTREAVLSVEALKILPHLEKKDTEGAKYCIALSERGVLLDSIKFSEKLSEIANGGANTLNGGIPTHGVENIIFIVGGALGLSQKVLDKADWVLSLSPMTFPHQMVRLILLEQLYRAFKIQHNEPYHK
ncbi:MAG: 23S rRNA (pseudouridine(1915)-N(3))-methyltransferase RlmH [Cyanobacteria bacterium]|nr:23S rRNA (pseudouridine(1915)-N(3))-methyltransferase RlmH [Cyanobacteriota bacterium]